MKQIKCIWVGKTRKSIWGEAFDQYWGRLSGLLSIQGVNVKEGPAHLGPAGRPEREAQSIIRRLDSRDRVITLDETGQAKSSLQFANELAKWLEAPGQRPCFVLGGAYGLGRQVHELARDSLSLGPMTLAHGLAQVVFLEQLYRAATILRRTPYHH